MASSTTPTKFIIKDILTVKSSTLLDDLKQKSPLLSNEIDIIKKYNKDLEEHFDSLYSVGFFSNPTSGEILKPPTEPSTEIINKVLNQLNTPEKPANPPSLLDNIRAKMGIVFGPRGGSNRKSNRKRKPKRKTRKCNKCPRCGAGKSLQELGADGHCHCNQCGHVY